MLKCINSENQFTKNIKPSDLKSADAFRESQYLGLMDYEKSLILQLDLHKMSVDRKQNYILGLEHPTCITLGLRAHSEFENYNLTCSWPVHKVSRGGLATMHNPGQLVIYPIYNLKQSEMGVRCFVHELFKATEKTMTDLGISSYIDEKEQPGIYTDAGKIAFCGLQVKNGSTLHGLSINISNQLSEFNAIQSCGINQAKLDKVAYYRPDITVSEFYEMWVNNFNI